MTLRTIVACIVLFAVQAGAWAAQDVTVVIDNAIVRADPRDGAEVIEYLPIGTEIRISDYPLEGGWYKVRAKDGRYGWIHEAYLSVAKTEESVAAAAEAAAAAEDERPKPERDRRFFVRAFYGLQFQGAADLNDLFSFTEFSMGNFFGGEGGYFVNPKFAFLLRAEVIYKDVVAKESVTGITYAMALRSYPVMAGAEYLIVKTPPLRLSLGAMAGLAFKTSFTTEALSLTTPNSLTLQDAPLAALARLNLTRPLGRTFSVFAEAGYRYLVSKELSTADAGSMHGGQVFIKNGRYQNRIIDLSGFELAAGLGVHF